MFNLTRGEKIVILFLIIAGVVGLGVRKYRLYQRKSTPKAISSDSSREEVALDKIIREETTININTAAAEYLMRLPGVGPAIARRIIAYRETHGPFKTIAQIKKVKGIGEKKFLKMRERIVLE